MSDKVLSYADIIFKNINKCDMCGHVACGCVKKTKSTKPAKPVCRGCGKTNCNHYKGNCVCKGDKPCVCYEELCGCTDLTKCQCFDDSATDTDYSDDDK